MKNVKEILVSALALTLIAGCVTAALAGTNALTAGTIAAQTAEAENAARLQVMEADTFEKQTDTDDSGEFVYYTAVKGGNTVGYVFTTQAVGKSSGLTVMTGISVDGKITGVVITDDNETAGYVNKIEKAGFPDSFAGKEATIFELGNQVDAVSQATKTSKGVLMAVNSAVKRYQIVREEAVQ